MTPYQASLPFDSEYDSVDFTTFKIEGVYCRLISLSKGMWAIVDESDYDQLIKWKWTAHKIGKTFYAYHSLPRVKGKTRKNVAMHRMILDFPIGLVDHKNHNGLDNRRKNIREATTSKNSQNAVLKGDNTSGYKGVMWQGRRNNWLARIQHNGKIHNKEFDTALEAHLWYCKMASELFGEFANPKGELES